MISGVVLAAGASTRMGRPKQTLALAGRPMLQMVIDTFLASGISEVVVVLSPDLAWRPGKNRRVRIAVNPRSSEGISTSVKMGIEAINQRSEAAIIGLGDKPLVRKSSIRRLVETLRSSHSDIVVPIYRGRLGNPILFRRSLFPELTRLKGDVGAKVLIESDKYTVARVPVGDSGVVLDVDTPEDLRKAERLLATRSRLGEGKSGKQVRL